ncbi:MAG: hypothetical protein ACYC4H_06835 [Desulfocucumaceae bacterium]
MNYPFEVPFSEMVNDIDPFVTAIFSCLESEFLVMPKGAGFLDYPVFEKGYETLKKATMGFRKFDPERLMTSVRETPLMLIVLRTMLGLTPPEWAYLVVQRTGVEVTQGFVRTLDRNVRLDPLKPLSSSSTTLKRVEALIRTACIMLRDEAPVVESDKLHRLDKADTRDGLSGMQTMATIGVPYAMLLYERFLGRPFAGHRDSVSELVGDSLEAAIEDVLTHSGISYRKTKRAERIAGFDQAPDFIIPSEYSPQVVIEAKITEDDGTARDKVTRIQHLAALSTAPGPNILPGFEVVACIGGRGFGVRREDMKKLLLATRGKVFTIRTMDKLVAYTRLGEFKTK